MSYISSFMWELGNTAIKDFANDYSVTPGSAVYAAPAGKLALITGLNIVIQSSGAQTAVDQYGNIALTNGLNFQISDDSDILDTLTNGSPVMTNGDYARYAEDVNVIDFGTGDVYVKVFHNFGKVSSPIVLDGDENQKFEITLADNFSALSSHTFYVSGILVPNNQSYRNRIHNKYMILD